MNENLMNSIKAINKSNYNIKTLKDYIELDIQNVVQGFLAETPVKIIHFDLSAKNLI